MDLRDRETEEDRHKKKMLNGGMFRDQSNFKLLKWHQ